jgi:CHAT domain-containing protein
MMITPIQTYHKLFIFLLLLWSHIQLGFAVTTCQTALSGDASQHTLLRQLTAQLRDADGSSPSTTMIVAYLQRGELYRMLGRLEDAQQDLTTAQRHAQAAHLTLLKIAATQALGDLAIQQRDWQGAETQLREAWTAALAIAEPTLAAASGNSLGLLLREQQQPAAARRILEQAHQYAQMAADSGLEAAILINLAAVQAHPKATLQRAQKRLQHVLDVQERGQLWLNLGVQAQQAQLTTMAEVAAQSALELAREHELMALAAMALGQQAQLSLAQGQVKNAVYQFSQAISVAPPSAYALRYPLEWQLGQLLHRQGDLQRALDAYRRAINHLERIRATIPIDYQDGRSSFRETLEPLYLELADLLLQTSTMVSNDADRQSLLQEARNTVEQIKLDELRDYFRDTCILPLRDDLTALAPHIAVLYPILLSDRLDMLVGIGDRLYRITQEVSKETISVTAEIMALKLRYDRTAEQEAHQLYTWLIEPIKSILDQHDIHTLVIIPDGSLRAVPFAALQHDDHYLVEDYAIAITPGLKLLDPEPLSKRHLTLLLAGLSQPGPVVNELPSWWLSAMVQAYRRGLSRGSSSTSTGEQRGVSIAVRGAETSSPPVLRGVSEEEKVAALALPGVAEEVKQLNGQLPGITLEDQAFSLSRFIDTLSAKSSYRIVHIASHGLFHGPPEDNFILTYDHPLDMNTLAQALKPKELSKNPVEILILSACQTAEGDDRTPLGLSGMALRSGARSALGSLWPVSDNATQQLMTEFYRYLRQPGLSRAQALRHAQQTLIHHDDYHRPSDWAAFILVGNWL